MKDGPLNVPTSVQIEAMLFGSIEELFYRNGLAEEELVDVHRYLTVTKHDFLDYFKEHPAAALSYFRAVPQEPVHESIMLQTSAAGYVLWVSDHGVPRGVKTFSSLEDAVAEHVLSVFGRAGK